MDKIVVHIALRKSNLINLAQIKVDIGVKMFPIHEASAVWYAVFLLSHGEHLENVVKAADIGESLGELFFTALVNKFQENEMFLRLYRNFQSAHWKSEAKLLLRKLSFLHSRTPLERRDVTHVIVYMAELLFVKLQLAPLNVILG